MVKIKTNTVKISHLSLRNCTKVSSELLMNLFMKKLSGTIITKETTALISAKIILGFIIFSILNKYIKTNLNKNYFLHILQRFQLVFKIIY